MYNEYGDPGHSISFNGMNTWSRWHLFPTSRPYVAPPEPKLKMEEVTGMTGVLDYSNVLTEDIKYKNRSGSWEFIALPFDDDIIDWKTTGIINETFTDGVLHEESIVYSNLKEKNLKIIDQNNDLSYKIIVDGIEKDIYEEVNNNVRKFIGLGVSVRVVNNLIERIEYTTEVSKKDTAVISIKCKGSAEDATWENAGIDNYTFKNGTLEKEKIMYEDLDFLEIPIEVTKSNEYKLILNDKEYYLTGDTSTLYTDGIAIEVSDGYIKSIIYNTTVDQNVTVKISLYYKSIVDGRELTWKVVYKDLYTYLHGRYFDRITFEDDPGWAFKGRAWVSSWNNDQQQTKVTIDYLLYPYKYSIIDDKNDWLWNDLFDLDIFYGNFTVKGSKWRTIINPYERTLMLTVNCEDSFDVYNETTDDTIELVKGENLNRLTIVPGDNVIKFIGNGKVSVEYIKEESL